MIKQIPLSFQNDSIAKDSIAAEFKVLSTKVLSKPVASLINEPVSDITFDSDDERYFYWYLEELSEAGYVDIFRRCLLPFGLSPVAKYDVLTPGKNVMKKKRLGLLQRHSYMPDFEFTWTKKARGVFFYTIHEGKDLRTAPFIANNKTNIPCSVVEIKPEYDRNNMIRLFRLNQKWVFWAHGIYVQEITVCGKKKGLFQDTFTPKKFQNRLTPKTRQPVKMNYQPINLINYIRERHREGVMVCD